MRSAFLTIVAAGVATVSIGLLEPLRSAAQAAPSIDEPAQTAPQRSVQLDAIIAALADRRAAATDRSDRDFLSEIEGYYREPGAKPLWTTETGFTDNGVAIVEEVSKAYTYGLDNAQFILPDMSVTNLDELATAEAQISLAVTKYIWHARGGRIDPSKLSLWLDQAPRPIYAANVLRMFETTADAAAVMRSVHPHQLGFENLRQAYLRERGLTPPLVLAPISPGPRIELGQKHPDVAAVRERLGYAASDPAYNDELDRRLMGRIREVMYEAGYERKNAIDDDVRKELNEIQRTAKPGTNKALLDKMLVNLERWRLMPEEMGRLYVWNNLPEFQTRVIKNGSTIHEERIVIGTPSTQTPVFFDQMSHVIFQPEWGVPESIKIRQILPYLKGGDYSVLDRRNMRIIDSNGKTIRPRFNWSKVNIRDVAIVQGAGSDNPLGRLKFIFPNKHDVYMHDTPSKDLFSTTVRTHSHGCIRVKNPDRFAEVILGETEGWTATDVKAQLAKKPTFQVDLKHPVPVYNTYFTVTADTSGKVTSVGDVYGHDKRMLDALNGKSVASIAAADPALAQIRANKELALNSAIITKAKPRPAKITVAKAQPGLFGYPPPQKLPPPSYLRRAPQAPKPLFFFFGGGY